ncbi:LacI family DNA-binding transcriptional regulator [Terriglobus aquaticus]|uniref:LacI family DNA-binding transcriptional regulator n=1 Tax=Terriglobus aquaticus TaxID=940139 RepID=A0ABW9KFU0_9BACT|nr:LacI family DNA-binding transcriptional regulator [Terriglobus aquaticus]
MAHTMHDVARRAGVSPATVSRVLSKNPYISAETTNRVLSAVKELHYHRNVHARRLAIGKSDLFGLVISEIANPFFSEIIRGFQSAAWDRGFDVLLLNTEYNPERTQSVVRKLIENDVRGVAVMTSSLDSDVIQTLTREGIAVVLSNLSAPDRLVSNITIDYGRGLSQAIEHIASLGHRRAAVIAGPPSNQTAANIATALVDGLKQRGLDPDPVTHSAYNVEAAAEAVKAIVSTKRTPTVIFCGSDLIAMGVMVALEQAGIDVPSEISVIGIDDIAFSYLVRPPLTTIRVPREDLGVTSFKALNKLLKQKRNRGDEYVIETELVIRKSTAAARTSLLRKKIEALKTGSKLQNL